MIPPLFLRKSRGHGGGIPVPHIRAARSSPASSPDPARGRMPAQHPAYARSPALEPHAILCYTAPTLYGGPTRHQAAVARAKTACCIEREGMT